MMRQILFPVQSTAASINKGLKYDNNKPPLFYNYWPSILSSSLCGFLTKQEKATAKLLTDLNVTTLGNRINEVIKLIIEQEKITTLQIIDTVSKVCYMGAMKYGFKNYLNGIEDERLISAAMRHLLQGFSALDKESKLPHWAHILSNLFMQKELHDERNHHNEKNKT